MATRESLRREVESLQAVIKARKLKVRETAEETEARLNARLESYFLQQAACETLPVAEKIAAKQAELAQLTAEYRPATPGTVCLDAEHLHRYRVRALEIDVLELQGTDAEIIETARHEANEQLRWRGQPPVEIPVEMPTHRSEPESEVSPTRQPRQPPMDRLAEYRGLEQPRFFEPKHPG
jgi:Asp/Glu/hydantoin racemase